MHGWPLRWTAFASSVSVSASAAVVRCVTAVPLEPVSLFRYRVAERLDCDSVCSSYGDSDHCSRSAADLLRAKVGDKRTSASREHHGAGSDGVHQRLRQVPDGVLDAASYERMQRICMSKWQDETSKWQSGKEEGIGDEGSEWAPCLQWWELPLRRSDCQTADDEFLFDCALALVKGCHLRTFAQKSKSGKLNNFFINALVRISNLIFT